MSAQRLQSQRLQNQVITSRYPQVEMMLAWEQPEQESKRFRKIVISILIFCLVFGVIIPWIDVPKDVRVINKVPDRFIFETFFQFRRFNYIESPNCLIRAKPK